MSDSTVTSKGQITIPKSIRDALDLNTGVRVSFRIREDGVVEMYPATVDVMSLYGILKPRKKGVSIKDMEKAIEDGATK